MPPPPRFGIVRNQNLPWQTLIRHWQVFEQLGFDSIWHADHYQRPSLPEAPSWKAGRCWRRWRYRLKNRASGFW